MDKEKLQSEGILKEEAIGYLKSALNMQQGNLVLTNKRLILDAHKTTVAVGGILGALLKKKVEEDKAIFDLEHSNIQRFVQGKHGVQKNVLEITDKQNNTYRIIVKDYPEWEGALKKVTGK
jgi:hypothetical protein